MLFEEQAPSPEETNWLSSRARETKAKGGCLIKKHFELMTVPATIVNTFSVTVFFCTCTF